MSEWLAVRSVPLSTDTQAAWKSVGVVFRARNRPHVWNVRFHEPHIRAVLNLGNIDLSFTNIPVPVFNAPAVVRQVSAPKALRRTLQEGLLPPSTFTDPHWHKTNGFKGVGKQFHESLTEQCDMMFGDVQRHVRGQEYRVVTVGDLIVQASKKYGSYPDFTYKWVGVNNIKSNGIITILKKAVACVDGGNMSILGWDVIHDGERPWIIEANTSPGVNQATAERIITKVKELI